ncbi:MAG: PCRF domain-containing protein [Myxococcales bacterium]|nr:PCRF domain-containing protein [Myxococcales bacterium]
MRATGSDVARFAQHETGGHRWQRVPPTEKRGRVHTSTVTVTVLPEARETHDVLDPRDVEIRTTGSGGAGGQHVNKRDTAVIATHLPTGTTVRIEGRSRHRNQQDALAVLAARLRLRAEERQHADRNALRRSHVGSGMRGDKRRTVALQRDTATDHGTGRTIRAKHYLRGGLDELWT